MLTDGGPKPPSKPTAPSAAKKLSAANASVVPESSDSSDSEGGSDAGSWVSEFVPDSGTEESPDSASDAESLQPLKITGQGKRARPNAQKDAPGKTLELEAQKPKDSLPKGGAKLNSHAKAGGKTAEGTGKKAAGKVIARGEVRLSGYILEVWLVYWCDGTNILLLESLSIACRYLAFWKT